MQAQAKINNNLVALFFLMSAGQFRGQTVNLGNCLCSPLQILATMNNNIAAFFTWFSGSAGVRAGIETLDSGATTKSVVFSTPFGAKPAVVCMVIAPDGSGFVVSVGGDDSAISASGFTADFAAAMPASGYKLMWIATPPS